MFGFTKQKNNVINDREKIEEILVEKEEVERVVNREKISKKE